MNILKTAFYFLTPGLHPKGTIANMQLNVKNESKREGNDKIHSKK